MKYRWGFLDENDNFTECDPKVDNATAIDYARESNEMFYRAKLNGSLAFRFEFDDIIAQGYNAEHRIVLQSFDNDLNDWREVWRGRFALTDCEIDFDTNTITVTPQTLDRYTNILDHIEDEYNLIKLAPEQLPVDILIRPLVQIYEVRDIKISNYIGNNYWEKDCDSVGRNDIDTYKFGLQKQYISVLIQYTDQVNPNFPYRAGKNILYVGEVIYGGLPQESTRVYGQYWDGASWQTDTLRVRVAQYTNTTEFQFYSDPDQPGSQQTPMVTAEYEAYGMGTIANITIGLPLMVDDASSQWDMICARILVQSDLNSVEIHGQTYTLEDIPNNDMAGSNLNYNKVFYADMIEIKVSNEVQSEPTQWGCNYKDEYFVKPTDVGFSRWMPVGQSLWKYFSIWWRIDATSVMTIINEQLTAEQTIKDSYPVINVVSKLLEKQGWNGNIISGCFGAENYVGAQMFPVITPKSNVISSYYNTPAQNAKITFAKILNMLKQAFKVYWYLDNNNDLHFEHVSYFDNGFSYTEGEPALLVDLDTTLHTNTKSVKDYGQNKIKFDKSDMPGSFAFGWMDAQTRPFDGWPIKCLDNYVSKGLIEEKIIGDFSTDVDFILSSPNDVSKDGFVLFALPYIEGAYSTKLVVDRFLITDENGASYYVELQNADAAFVKIHRSWWRYQLPCENVNINNVDTNAITTGNFKSQAVEFADTAMAEVLKDVDNANKIIRTQQGDGHVKTISVNLNSLKTSGDLLFNFVGRWYYLRGAALGNSIIINFNGESITISVDDNRFTYRYKEPISVLKFNAADVVSVNFADVDKLDNLTSADEMFDGCEELLAVDFGNKTFGAVTSANNMFRGCVALTTLICPDSSTWKADLDFSDCPDLTLESFYDLIKFLYFYNSGVHTITPNSTMWNTLDADTQNDLIAKATERGWTINIPAQYSVTGESTSSTVYATINGTAVEIPVTGGVWQYNYNAAITSISFENDSNLTMVDFSLSDGLAGLTTLADAFKNCSALTNIDFSNCDLSNVASATDIFAGCTSLTELIVPAGTWKPDVDLSDTVILYSEMLNVVDGLYSYTGGVHNVTFNSTIWNAMSVAEQQAVFDAAGLKYWTTNSVAVLYYIRGNSSAHNSSETFTIQFIDNGSLTPSPSETITVTTDASGDFALQYDDSKKIYSLDGFAKNLTTITALDFSASDGLTELTSAANAFDGCTALSAINVGSFTWKPDIILSNSPVSGVSMVAFMGNFADYSLGSQHIVRISPYSAADMGANADTIKTTLSSKNWRLPLSQQGKYTRTQLKTMVDNGYIPISSEGDFAQIGTATASVFGEDSEFYGTYTSLTNSNSILVQSWSTVNLMSRDIGGIFDGNNLKIQTNYDYGDNPNAFFRNIATGAILRNVVFYGVGYAHNSNRSFVYQNDGVVEDCIVNIDLQAAVYCQAFIGNNYGTIRRCAVRAVHTKWPTSSNWSVTYLFQNNDGQVEDCILLGTYKRSNSVNVTGVMFVRSNNAGGVVERCICNALANLASTGFGLTNSGTIVDCLENSDRNFSRVVGGTLAKTGAELIADNIGSGIYAKYDPNVWTKDNDGYPTLIIEKDFDWGGDYTNITSYDALLALVKILETQLTEYTITVDATLWNSLDPSTQQAEILGILSAKNYDLTI